MKPSPERDEAEAIDELLSNDPLCLWLGLGLVGAIFLLALYLRLTGR